MGKISAGVPQGSILGPLLFNIFINDIFLFLQKCDLANYADDSIMNTSNKRVSTIVDSLRHEFTILSKWFYLIVLNPEKCSFMLLGVDGSLQINLACGDEILKNKKQEVLGATLDNKLNFAIHLLNITKNAIEKFNALTWVQKYMTTDQKKLITPLLNHNLHTFRWHECFVQNVPFPEWAIYKSGACAMHSKTTDPNL